MNYSIILPTLNENGHIIKLINAIIKNFRGKKVKYEVIVVDDNSIDGTINTVKKESIRNNKIRFFVRKNKKKNLAASLNLGIKQSRYENIIWMDADFQHPPEYIKYMFKHMQKKDIIIYSRFLKKSVRYFDNKKFPKENNEDQSVLFNKLCNLIFYKDITDYTSGYICIKKNIINKKSLKGFYGEYFLDLIVYCKKKKLKILELPFKEKIRKTGQSKTIGGNKVRYIILCLNYVLSIFVNFIKKTIH
ncbi:glycosyltransferase [Candidatus Pelagibacter sp.]|nr:glycosyltransferase [Candidatus Pelagibacter sp.]